jgi:hypothetical protein
MEGRIAYRTLFDHFAGPGDKFNEDWMDRFEDSIIEGQVLGSLSSIGFELPTPTSDLMGHTKHLARPLKP